LREPLIEVKRSRKGAKTQRFAENHPTFRFLAVAGFDLTSVREAFFFAAAGAALTIGLREDACKLFLRAVMMSSRGISSSFSNSATFLPLILESISLRRAS
jgi:hypothetical protein